MCGAEEGARAVLLAGLLVAAVGLATVLSALVPADAGLAGLSAKGKDPRRLADAAQARQAPSSRWPALPGPPKPPRTRPCEDHDPYRSGPW